MKSKKALVGLITVLIAGTMCFAMTGCSWFESKINDIRGNLSGVAFDMTAYDNFGEVTLTSHGEKISLKGNYVDELVYNDDGIGHQRSLSSVVTINIDGKEMETCGDTVIFAETGLNKDIDFYETLYDGEGGAPDIVSIDDGDFVDNTALAYVLNRYENVFGKSRVVVIKSQMGRPLCAYSGDKIYYEVKEDLPKTTKLMVDGKALYIHRANFQIFDTELLK